MRGLFWRCRGNIKQLLPETFKVSKSCYCMWDDIFPCCRNIARHHEILWNSYHTHLPHLTSSCEAVCISEDQHQSFTVFPRFFSLKTGKFHQGRGTPPQPLGCPAICSRQWRHGHSTDGKWKDSCFFGRFAILPKKKPWGITRLIEDAGGLYTICFVKCVLNWYHEMQSMQTTWNDLRLVIVSYIIYQCMYQCIYLYSYIIACVCV